MTDHDPDQPDHDAPPHHGPLRQAQVVLSQLRWDPRFDASRATVEHEERDGVRVETPVLAFDPSVVPWHRVWVFRVDGAIVWDRAARLDRLDEAARGAAGGPEDAPRGLPCALTPLRPWRPDAGGAWRAVRDAPASGPARGLRVLTWNVLAEHLAPDPTTSALRHDALLAEVERADPDIIALQEATPGLIERIQAAPWARGHATSTGAQHTRRPRQGPLLVSRLPVLRLGEHKDEQGKRTVVAEVDAGGGRIVLVVVVHLKSDRRGDASDQRAGELARVLDGGDWRLPDGPAALVLGDLNAVREDGPDLALLSWLGFVDAWSALHPGEAGPTYDPTTNPLAALTTVAGRPWRFDRVLVRPGLHGLRPTRIERVGQARLPAPHDHLTPSDHVGVWADLAWTDPPGAGKD